MVLGVAGAPRAASATDTGGFEPPKPQLEYMARFTVDLEAPVWELGKTSDLGARRIIPITGGTFSGPLLNGEILNNGADWQVVTADGLAIIDTRCLLKANDGSLIYLQTKGYRYGPSEVLAEVAKGNPVDPNKYSFRLTMTFKTASQKYSWLNRAIGVGYAMRLGKAVVYDAYLVK
ncbi:conserved hypothetical protein [Methylobacterium nodulans ORS 2060]|uniref:UPF0311 protein Mnod_6460 n=2 Tax=Methylobacterium nodulans TaxID=114616 RepID=B8IC56_METNO|nr:conserved hypothetical protein [Methylobacterium nodulans ORS 2060]